jgi:hypothetical protein
VRQFFGLKDNIQHVISVTTKVDSNPPQSFMMIARPAFAAAPTVKASRSIPDADVNDKPKGIVCAAMSVFARRPVMTNPYRVRRREVVDQLS